MKILLDTHVLLWLLADLPLHHRDPFDRMLLAQVKRFGMKILSHDDRFPAYGDFVSAV